MKPKQHFHIFILLSFLVHAGILSALLFVSFFKPTDVPKNDVIEISFNEELEPTTANAKTRALPQPRLVVESDKENANDILSEKTRFLSDRSNTVAKETRAVTGDKFKNVQTKAQAARALTDENKAATGDKKITQKSLQKPTERSKSEKLFGEGFNAYEKLAQKQEAQQQQIAAKRAIASVGSTTNDNLEGVSSDLITRLNTREYRYAGYYHRIKEQLNGWWVPGVQEKFSKMMQQGRTIAANEDKVTKLIIVLNPQGNLVNVQVLAESGVRDLDDAAIEAFRSAAPFPNPPKGMIDSDGTVKIRWDCVVES